MAPCAPFHDLMLLFPSPPQVFLFFVDPALEARYACMQFKESLRISVMWMLTTAAFTLLLGFNILGSSSAIYLLMAIFFMLGGRTTLHMMENQSVARKIWCGAWPHDCVWIPSIEHK